MSNMLKQIAFKEDVPFPDISSEGFTHFLENMTTKNLAKAAGVSENEFNKSIKFCFRIAAKTEGKFGFSPEEDNRLTISKQFGQMTHYTFDKIPNKYVRMLLQNEAMSRCQWKDMLQLVRNILAAMSKDADSYPNFEASVRMFGHPDNDATTGFTVWLNEVIDSDTEFGSMLKDQYEADELEGLRIGFEHYTTKLDMHDRHKYEQQSAAKNLNNYSWSLFEMIKLPDGNTIAYCVENIGMIPIPTFLFVAAIDALKIFLTDADGGPVLKAAKCSLNKPPPVTSKAFTHWINWNRAARKNLHEFLSRRFARHYVYNETYIRDFIETLINEHKNIDVKKLKSKMPQTLLEYNGSILTKEHQEIGKQQQAYDGYLELWEKQLTAKLKQEQEESEEIKMTKKNTDNKKDDSQGQHSKSAQIKRDKPSNKRQRNKSDSSNSSSTSVATKPTKKHSSSKFNISSDDDDRQSTSD